jgi:hypothetical protein
MDNDLVYVHTYLPGISRFLRCDHLHAPGERVARIVLARRRRGDGSQCFYINIDIAILSLFFNSSENQVYYSNACELFNDLYSISLVFFSSSFLSFVLSCI